MKACCPECGHEFTVATQQETAHRKKCPACGSFGMVDLPSMNKRVCFCCHAEFDWKLKPKQKSVLIEGLRGEENE